ncbi:plasmid mobilization protein [Ekhidna sp.]|uniref:plasmid mobilization protein n=1 Tax=Ekhidna sp. TaxID=2608089 RepID=UPI003C7C6D00
MRDKKISVMASASQKDLIKKYASNASLTVSTYLLKAGLKHHIKPALTGVMVLLYRHLVNANEACDNRDYNQVKKELESAIKLFINRANKS